MEVRICHCELFASVLHHSMKRNYKASRLDRAHRMINFKIYVIQYKILFAGRKIKEEKKIDSPIKSVYNIQTKFSLRSEFEMDSQRRATKKYYLLIP